MSSRQKSCNPCANAKRRCSPQYPQCPRCARLGLDCQYKNQPLRGSAAPGTKPVAGALPRRPARRQAGRGGGRAVDLVVEDLDWVAPGSYDVEGAVEAPDVVDLTRGSSDIPVLQPQQQQAPSAQAAAPDPQLPLLPQADLDQPVSGAEIPPAYYIAEEGGDLIRQGQRSQPLDLGLGTFSLPDPNFEFVPAPQSPIGTIADLVQQEFPRVVAIDAWATNKLVRNIMSWPRKFVKSLETPFILSTSGDGSALAKPLRDAFGACAGYASKTPANKAVALGVVEETAHDLLRQDPLQMSPEAHLHSLQALVVLHSIQLWDGDHRQRALAEAQGQTVEDWAHQLHRRLLFNEFDVVGASMALAPADTATTVPADLSAQLQEQSSSSVSSRKRKARVIDAVQRTVLMTLFSQAAYEAAKYGLCTYLPAMAGLPVTPSGVGAGEGPRPTYLGIGEGGGMVTYIGFVLWWRARLRRVAGPQEPVPLDSFFRLILAPCVGVAYKTALAFPTDEDED